MRINKLTTLLVGLALITWASAAHAQPVKPNILMIFDTSGSMLSSSCDGQSAPVGDGLDGIGSNIYNVKEAMYQALFFAGTDEVNFGLMRFPEMENACNLDSCNFGTSTAGYYRYVAAQYGGANPNNACKLSTHNNETTYAAAWFDPGISEVLLVPVTDYTAGLQPGGPGDFDPTDANIPEILRWIDHTTTCTGGAIQNPEVQAIPGSYTPLGRSIFYARNYFENYVVPNDDPNVLPCRTNIIILLTDGAETCDQTMGGATPPCTGGTEFNPRRQACLTWNNAGIPVYVIAASSSTGGDNIAAAGGTGQAIIANFTDQNAVKSALLQIIADAVPSGEVCNNVDDNCNGLIDEGVKNACPTYPEWCATELCNGIDDDCDGQIDEGHPPNACGGPCGEPVPAEIPCDGIDNDCNPATPDQPPGCTCGVEFCNGLDDDCDGLIDDDDPDLSQTTIPCGPNPALGICEQGVLICNYGNSYCDGAVYPEPETCDGLDNNCNGIIDDVVYFPMECVIPNCTTACCEGHWACVNGADTCVPNAITATEDCNGEDDDCDGRIDEGALCPQPFVCYYGTCVNHVPPDGCGPDAHSVEGLCVPDPCVGSHCAGGLICDPVTGDCVDPCLGVVCVDPNASCDVTLATCDATGGCAADESDCVLGNCYLNPSLCTDGQICEAGLCVDDACFGTNAIDCGTQVCRDATCIDSCAGVECDAGWACQDGNCVVVPCGTFVCPPGQACVDEQCAQDPCGGVTCLSGQVCVDGQCVDDPCRLVVCPTGTQCVDGQCISAEVDPDAGPQTDAQAGDGGVTDAGDATQVDANTSEFDLTVVGGGCTCDTGAGGRSSGLLLLFILGALWFRRRRR